MTRRVAQLGLFLALALILAYVESLIPFSFGIPGIKLGLPNLIVVLLLYGGGRKSSSPADRGGTQDAAVRVGGIRDALLINLLRIVISGFLFSGLYTILYALAGAFAAFAAMLFGRRIFRLSVVGVSVLGGVFHNIGQLAAAACVTQTVYIGWYAPALIAAGTVTGAALGIAAGALLPYLTKTTDGR